MAAQSEAAFQQECRISFHNKYPHLRKLLFHVRNNSKDKREGAYWKELGVVAGVSDFIFLFAGRCWCIELKTPTGYQSPDQIEWQLRVEQQSIFYQTVNSIEKFDKLINDIVTGKIYEK